MDEIEIVKEVGNRNPRLRDSSPEPAIANPNKIDNSSLNLKLQKAIKNLKKNYRKTAPKSHIKTISLKQGITIDRHNRRVIRKVRPKKKIKCPSCKVRVNDYKSLRDHSRKRHQVKRDGSLCYCKLCDKKFTGEIQEAQHLAGRKHNIKRAKHQAWLKAKREERNKIFFKSKQ